MADYPKLMVLSEKFRGMVFELKEDAVTVGRNEQRDICIKDPSMSSYHCDFIHTEEGYFVCDRDSTNGTRLNNVPLNPDEMYPLPAAPPGLPRRRCALQQIFRRPDSSQRPQRRPLQQLPGHNL